MQSTLLLLLSITVLAATGAIAGLAQAAQQGTGTPSTTPNTTVVTVEFRLGGSNDTVVNRVECGNLTVVTILSGDNTTSSGRVVFSLRVEGAQGDATSILSRAYDCVSRRSDMSIARIVLDAVINATDTATRSKPQPVTQAQSQIEPFTIQAEDSKTQAPQQEAVTGAQQDTGSPQQAVTGEATGTVAGQAGAVEAPISAGVQDATTASTGEPSITRLLMPLAAGTLLGLLFYYLARIL